MQWPSWATFWRKELREDDGDNKETQENSQHARAGVPPTTAGLWETNLNTTDWTHYTTTQTITISIITAATTLALARVWKRYLRRIPTVDYLKPGFFHRRSFYGRVTRVGDGDNFHLYHTPGGRLMGWGWLPKRRVQDMKPQALKGNTMHVRLAGIDAPELAHFGRPAQPYSQEAIDWLKSFILNKQVRVYPYREDQYKRVVCSVYKRRFGVFKADVGLNMLKRGLATVYEAKFGSEFGNREKDYRAAEQTAKNKKVGMWQEPGLVARILGQKKDNVETPREYKTRMAEQDKTSKASNLAK